MIAESQRTLDAWRQRVDARLQSVLADGAGDAPELFRAMRYAVTAGGKRLRPLLVIAGAVAVGGDEDDALPAATAVELIHTYSLIHDDLPAMDDDALRRGRPTVHIEFDEATAILAGDGLQALAFEVVSRSSLPADRVQRQVRTLARAAGPRGMAGGQALDLAAERQAADEQAVARIHRMKTGALIAASVRLGAESAGVDDELAARMEHVGQLVGLAFQIQDDILDETAPTEVLGKTAGKDVATGKATWPAVVGLDTARRQARELVETALAELKGFGSGAEPLRRLVRRAVDRTA